MFHILQILFQDDMKEGSNEEDEEDEDDDENRDEE